MNQNDMELQAIRDKLQSLQNEAPAAEALSLPWSPLGEQDLSSHTASHRLPLNHGDRNHTDNHHSNSRLPNAVSSQPSYNTVSSQPSYVDPELHPTSAKQHEPLRQAVDNRSPQEIAIEALKQRSRGGESANARMDSLIAQELYRLEIQANLINEQSQRQAEDILALKRSAQQASVGLRRQGIHNHPQLEVITHFLERYSSAAVPRIERDDRGHFALLYSTVDFRRAEKDALETAKDLRDRHWQSNDASLGELQDKLFSHPLPSGSSSQEGRYAEHSAIENSSIEQHLDNSREESSQAGRTKKNRFQKSIGNTIDKVLYLFGQNKQRKKKVSALSSEIVEGLEIGTAAELEEGFISSDAHSSDMYLALEIGGNDNHEADDELTGQLSWMDAAIWFSGAAIARIIVQAIAVSYPIAQTLFVLALAAAITFALYRVTIARSNNYGLIYRLCVVMAGLLVIALVR